MLDDIEIDPAGSDLYIACST